MTAFVLLKDWRSMWRCGSAYCGDIQIARDWFQGVRSHLLAEDDRERTEVDLGSDGRVFPVEPGPGFPILSHGELAVDKVLSVLGRAEARDFVDLMAMENQFGLERLFKVAVDKDRGFSPAMFAQMMNRFDRLHRSEFPIDDEGYQQLSRVIGIWRVRALEFSRQQEQRRGVRRDQGPDISFDP
jgi:hypothetical protein